MPIALIMILLAYSHEQPDLPAHHAKAQVVKRDCDFASRPLQQGTGTVRGFCTGGK